MPLMFLAGYLVVGLISVLLTMYLAIKNDLIDRNELESSPAITAMMVLIWLLWPFALVLTALVCIGYLLRKLLLKFFDAIKKDIK